MRVYWWGIPAFAITVWIALSTGPASIGFEQWWRAHDDPLVQTVMWEIRAPRMMLGMLVGMVLAQSGVVLQGIFRNPLADPGLVGVSSGAALGAAVVLFVWPAAPYLGMVAAAFGGALGATALVIRLASSAGQIPVLMMMLAGVAVAAMTGAVVGALSYFADDQTLRSMSLWQMGSLAGVSGDRLGVLAALAVLAATVFQRQARVLDALSLGERQATDLGIDVERSKSLLVWTVALVVGATVALTGIIGFIGLVVPHAVRLLVGPGHRLLLPLSAAAGALVLAWADTLARILISPSELPIGIITGCWVHLFSSSY